VLSGRGLCDGLITRPEESYRVWCLSAILKPRQRGVRGQIGAVAPRGRGEVDDRQIYIAGFITQVLGNQPQERIRVAHSKNINFFLHFLS